MVLFVFTTQFFSSGEDNADELCYMGILGY
jgi:hypothetical protein